MGSSFLYRAPWNKGLWSPLLVLEVLLPTECLIPTRHELFATSSPVGLVTLAPIPAWQGCLQCLATRFYHLAFQCGLNLSLVTFGATGMLWVQVSNMCSRPSVYISVEILRAGPFMEHSLSRGGETARLPGGSSRGTFSRNMPHHPPP